MIGSNLRGYALRIAIVIAALVVMAGGAGAATSVTFFSDDFNGSALNSVWTVINKNSDSSISLTGTGYLRINASPKNSGSDYYNSSNYNAPRILQSISGIGSGYGGIIETKMIFSPANNYQGAGTLLCSDDNPDSNTCIRAAERAFYPQAGGSVVRSGGTYVGYTNSTTYFRIMKEGTSGKGWFSSNGVDWILNGEGTVSIPLKYAGLFAVRQPWDGDTNVYSKADFDYINIIVFNGTTLTVDDSGGADYTMIQDAIDNATNGDTILVYSGTYHENVNVNKQLILRGIDSNGGGKPVVDANRKDFGILINASGVTLEGFEIINSSIEDPGAGILVASNNNKIINNNALNNIYGIMLLNSSYSTVENNIANNNTRFQGVVNGPPPSTGIIVAGSHNTIRNNNASNNFYGISVFSGGPEGSIISVNNTIEGNTVINNTGIAGENQPPSSGILLGASNNNIIRNNAVLTNSFGILVHGSNNTIRNNNASNNFYGISVFSGGPNSSIISANNTIEGNTVINNTGINGGNQPPSSGILLGESHSNIIRNNTALNNILGIGIFSSGNNTLANNTASGNSDRGILLDNTSNTTVSNNNVSYNGGGILLVQGSRNNIIINNVASNNSRWGIDVSHLSTDNNQIINNIANWNNYSGINLNYSNNNSISDNIANGNGWNGIWLDSSSNNIIRYNNASLNGDNGIVLHSFSNYNKLTGNKANDNHHGLYLKSSSDNMLTNNIANANIAQGIVLNASNNNILLNNRADGNNYNGILVEYFSSFNTLNGNHASNHNDSGIHLDWANNNTIINNTLNENRNNGVQLYNSINNIIYHNNLINNFRNAFDNSPNNSWDSGYPSGGNYWSDYTGSDMKSGSSQNIPGSDGIGDTPYNISGGAGAQDLYPFIKQNGWISAVAKGDVSGDGKVTVVDALFIAQYTVGLRSLNSQQLAAADVNNDGQVNIVDALFIAQYTVGLRQL